MKYFLHDTNASQDEKLMELRDEFGYEGLGLFFTALEKFGYHESPIKTSVLKKHLGIGKRLEKCWQFMEEIGLITSINGESFNEKIMEYSKKYAIQKEKNWIRISQWRENQLLEKSVTGYKSVRDASKVNKREIKESTSSDTMSIPYLFDKEDENKLTAKRFIKPTLEEVVAYMKERNVPGYELEAQKFINYYESIGWRVSGKSPMKDWHGAARNWGLRAQNYNPGLTGSQEGGEQKPKLKW